jgi:hypothetical protein
MARSKNPEVLHHSVFKAAAALLVEFFKLLSPNDH